MLRLQDLLFVLRRNGVPRTQVATDRQLDAIEALGLGSPPDNISFSEASAILTARNVAREVLQVLGGEARITRVIRLQLEPCVILAILSDRKVLFELLERNKRRLSFCKCGDQPPTVQTRNAIYRETRRLIDGVPYANHKVLKASQKKKSIGSSRTGYQLHGPRRKPKISVQRKGLLTILVTFVRTQLFGRSPSLHQQEQIAVERQRRLSKGPEEVLCGRASVIDGDTIEVHGQRVRIWGIDAPEGGQLGIKDRRPWRCGHDCAVALAAFIGARTVECIPEDRDEYERLVARCVVEGQDIGDWMVRNGWALDLAQYSNGYYAEAQAKAQQAELGLWQGEFEMPWKWRVRSRWLLENLPTT